MVPSCSRSLQRPVSYRDPIKPLRQIHLMSPARCWLQPEDVWINKPAEKHELALEVSFIKAV
jgi:hypothetical protein